MLTISQLSMRFGAKVLFKNVSLQFNPGNRYGLIGANGCGKSTFIQLLISEKRPESGSIHLSQQLSLGSLSQDHYLFGNQLTLHVVLQGKKKLWNALEKKRVLLEKEAFDQHDCEKLVELDKEIEEQQGYAAEAEAAKLLEGLGVRTEWHLQTLSALSGGYKLRVLLAQVLFSQPDILVLDEPTNHLDVYSIKWLENYLRAFPGTVIVTSHDREFLNGICTHLADVDYGTIKIYKGNYDAFEKQKALDREQKEHLLQKNEKRCLELQNFIDRFGAKATKARQAQSKARLVEQLEEEKEALELFPSSRLYPKFQFDSARASGVTVLTVKGISKAYGGQKVLDGVSFEVERGEKVAILGPNGIGKSTLLNLLTGHQTADSGSYNWGFATRLAYFPQDHTREIQGNATLLEWLGQFDPDFPQEKLRDLLGRVLFSGEKVNQSIATLSGGEKARLLLAKIMLQKPNVLLFDEPTNHLDMEAIEELVRALERFEGTLLLVSHNRYFVSRVAKRIVEISHQGVTDFKGNYDEYVERQKAEEAANAFALSARASHVNPMRGSSSYDDQRKMRSQKARLKKKVEQAEHACHQLESRLQEIAQHMAAEGFYLHTPREEQQQFIHDQLQLESQLVEALDAWERASLELQQHEGSA